MRFTLMLGLGGQEDCKVIAQAAEAAGWHAISVPDSLFYPQMSESDYPYADTAAVRQALEGTPVADPLIAIATMAAVTERIRFYPGVLKVPVRQPLVLAKALGSVATLSNNRLSLGAGLSPWKEDFTYNGLAFEGRGRLMDECLHILHEALTGEYFEFHSDNFDIGPIKMSPAPTRKIPLLIGGHSKAAMKRAARLGDGWISANTDRDTLAQLIGQLQQTRSEYPDNCPENFEIHALDSNVRTIADCEQLAAMGVTDACITPWNPYQDRLSLADKLQAIEGFAESVISRFG